MFSDGIIRNIKAFYCVRGNNQISGVGYFYTYETMVQQLTVQIIRILSQVLNLKTKQKYYTNKLSQYPLEDYEEVCIELTCGFDINREGEFVDHPNSVLYDIFQLPKRWFDMLYMGLEAFGMSHYDYGPFIFITEHVICMIYVDDFLFFVKEDHYINTIVEKMCDHKFELEYEYQIITVLIGIYDDKTITSNENTIKFKIYCHIYLLLELTGMDDCISRDTPAIQTLLGSDMDVVPFKETYKWIYVVRVCMLQYLSKNSRPDIKISVNQVICLTHNPKLSHDITIKHRCRYLKGTREKLLVLNHTNILNMCFNVDNNFSGLCHVGNPEE